MYVFALSFVHIDPTFNFINMSFMLSIRVIRVRYSQSSSMVYLHKYTDNIEKHFSKSSCKATGNIIKTWLWRL